MRIPSFTPSDAYRIVYTLLDEDGIPIYIGCTTDLKKRVAGLKCSRWWPEVAEIKASRYDREVGPIVERALIGALRPLHNKAGVSTWYVPPKGEERGLRHVQRVLLREIFRLGMAGTFDQEEQAA